MTERGRQDMGASVWGYEIEWDDVSLTYVVRVVSSGRVVFEARRYDACVAWIEGRVS